MPVHTTPPALSVFGSSPGLYTSITSVDEMRDAIPSRGETALITTNGEFSAWQFVPLLCSPTMGHGICERATITTYNMSKDVVFSIEQLVRDERIIIAQIVISESLERLSDRGAAYRCLDAASRATGDRVRWAKAKLHAKTISLRMSSGLCYVIVGSGNMAYNTKHEAYVVLTDPKAYEHVAEWVIRLVGKGAN